MSYRPLRREIDLEPVIEKTNIHTLYLTIPFFRKGLLHNAVYERADISTPEKSIYELKETRCIDKPDCIVTYEGLGGFTS